MPTPKTGLKQGLALFALGAIMLPIVVIGVMLLSYHKRTTLKEINRQNVRMATAIRDDVNTFLEAPLRTVSTVAQFSMDGNTSAQLDSLVTKMVEDSGFYESILVLDKGGIVRSLGTSNDVSLIRRDYLGIDLSQADHFTNARQLQRHAWSDTFISPLTGKPTLSLTLPFDNGMVVGNFSLDRLSRVMTHLQDDTNDRVFLVNGKGRIIAHPDRNRVLRHESVADLAIVKAGLSGHEGAYQYSEDGVAMIGAVARVAETGWLVVVEQNRDEVFAQQYNMELVLVLVLFCSLLAVTLFILYFNSRVVNPIIAISSATKHVAAGSFSCIDLPREGLRFRELRELTENFNAMAATIALREEELQDSNLELEHEIDERMHIEEALQERNEELTAIEEELRTQLDETLIGQEALLQSEERLLLYFESMPIACITWDSDLRVQRWNPAAETIFGHSAKQTIAKNARELFTADSALLVAMLQDTMTGAATASRLIESQTENGRSILCEWSNTPVKDHLGKANGVISMIQDITGRRLLERQVMQQQKMEGIGLMAGGIAHDFNNLLTPIFGYAEMIRNKFSPGEQIHTRASAILEAANKARELIRQLLSFSRRQLLATENCDLNEIITAFMTIMRSTLRENVEIPWIPCAEPCPVKVDRTQIEQVLLNLMINSQDAISNNGRITIETGHLLLDDEYCRHHSGARPGRYVMLTFSDDGCGMADETLAHIFEPFFTTKHSGHGTGLGLSTVYGIVKQHDGYIDAQSRPGHGTTFRIFLPEIPGDIDLKSAPAQPATTCPLVTGTILLVEDNQMVMDVSRDLLTSCGHTVLPAGTPQEALALAEANRGALDLLVSDVIMPQMSGPELYEQLAKLQPGLKVLYMSGYTSNLVAPQGTLEEEFNFIAKPFTSEKFVGRIAELLIKTDNKKASEAFETPQAYLT